MLNINLEIPAIVCGVANVYLAARAHVFNWFFGIITVSLYIIIFLHAKLYADMLLQVVFLFLQFYGLYSWRNQTKHSNNSIKKASQKILLFAAFLTFLLFLCIAFLLKNYTDSTTVYLDAFTTALSLVAQWMLTKKWIENWLLWIIVDIVSINMYLLKHLYLTSILYALFFSLCVMGYYTWQKQYKNHLKN